MLNHTAIHHQTAKVALYVIFWAVYTCRRAHAHVQKTHCTQTLHHHTVKFDLWKVTAASVFLIINGTGSEGVISQSHKGNGVIRCGGGP